MPEPETRDPLCNARRFTKFPVLNPVNPDVIRIMYARMEDWCYICKNDKHALDAKTKADLNSFRDRGLTKDLYTVTMDQIHDKVRIGSGH